MVWLVPHSVLAKRLLSTMPKEAVSRVLVILSVLVLVVVTVDVPVKNLTAKNIKEAVTGQGSEHFWSRRMHQQVI